jgi:hypothetical protein
MISGKTRLSILAFRFNSILNIKILLAKYDPLVSHKKASMDPTILAFAIKPPGFIF